MVGPHKIDVRNARTINVFSEADSFTLECDTARKGYPARFEVSVGADKVRDTVAWLLKNTQAVLTFRGDFIKPRCVPEDTNSGLQYRTGVTFGLSSDNDHFGEYALPYFFPPNKFTYTYGTHQVTPQLVVKTVDVVCNETGTQEAENARMVDIFKQMKQRVASYSFGVDYHLRCSDPSLADSTGPAIVLNTAIDDLALTNWDISPDRIVQRHAHQGQLVEIPVDDMRSADAWMQGSSLEAFKSLCHFFTKEHFIHARTKLDSFLNANCKNEEWEEVLDSLYIMLALYTQMAKAGSGTPKQFEDLYTHAMRVSNRARELYETDPQSPAFKFFNAQVWNPIFNYQIRMSHQGNTPNFMVDTWIKV